jgi:hypothetical protein
VWEVETDKYFTTLNFCIVTTGVSVTIILLQSREQVGNLYCNEEEARQ